MGFYVTSPFKPSPKLLVEGRPQHVFGSWDEKSAPTVGWITTDSAATTTATVTFQLTQGNLPAAGDLITIVGSANSAGIFNVTNALILTVTNTGAGLVTVTFTISSTTQATLADSGQVLIPRSHLGDIVTTTGASVPVAAAATLPNNLGKSVTVQVNLPASNSVVANTLSGVTITLEGSNFDIDADYQTIATVATTVAAGSVTNWQSGQSNPAGGTDSQGKANLSDWNFYRLHITAVGSGSGPIEATIRI